MNQTNLDKLITAVHSSKEGLIIDSERKIAILTLPLFERLAKHIPNDLILPRQNGSPLEKVDKIYEDIKARFGPREEIKNHE